MTEPDAARSVAVHADPDRCSDAQGVERTSHRACEGAQVQRMYGSGEMSDTSGRWLRRIAMLARRLTGSHPPTLLGCSTSRNGDRSSRLSVGSSFVVAKRDERARIASVTSTRCLPGEARDAPTPNEPKRAECAAHPWPPWAFMGAGAPPTDARSRDSVA